MNNEMLEVARVYATDRSPTISYPSPDEMTEINTLSEYVAKYKEINKGNIDKAMDFLRFSLYQPWNINPMFKDRMLPMMGKMLVVDSCGDI